MEVLMATILLAVPTATALGAIPFALLALSALTLVLGCRRGALRPPRRR
jgi:hypothetical protein